ncbi:MULTISPECIES: response regulator [Pseudomonadaceae]|uniref:Response regulator n=2 Tax=Ectopseudomonas toyotomiensis TaxID=554344 RepID=A0A2G5G2S0_9GAMM|nr:MULTISPECIES: response regulator [Pseudomonas]MBG0843246.1 response regulator [Pseudomonas toyotomiensis]MDH0703959.1 response regulator [Pseudomonas toyotomiensis]MDM9653380.1 response regulator [Pseudomonas wenzhouensis]PIA74524.1 two-component system response regulator [Pseudomonas toyotomiensis]QSL95231.1 response regulator [Pseudomonas toyotomiensis]
MMSAPVRILFVDDEERILRSLALQFRRHYEVLTESDPLRALQRLREEHIHVLVSDQRMPQMSGAQLLAEAREIAPNTLRILLTGYSDLDAAVEALNNGGIFRYLTKPWDQQEMAFTLRQAAELAVRQAQPLQSVASEGLSAPLSVLLLDDDPDTLSVVGEFCVAGGHRLLRARNLAEAMLQLNNEGVDILVSDLKLAGEDTAPLLKTLAQAHPRLLSLVVTPFQDTQALLRLVNEAQIFRYLPKPIRRGLFEKGLKAAAEQALIWRAQPQQVVTRLAEVPRDEREQEKVGSLLGMLGRLRERLIA